MTTTLRPTGPEEHGPDGARSRAYDICVNSRPVGIVRLATDEQFGPSAGRITQLAVDERERRRGRATVAALAAEEVLRGWGCDRIEAGIPERAPAALRLAETLGYRLRSRNLLKRLPETPQELPQGSAVRTMTDAEFDEWRTRDREMVADTLAARGVPRAQAEAKADAAYRRQLPNGPSTPGAALRVLEHEGEPVGMFWATPGDAPRDDADAWVYAVEVHEEHRGRGHGRTLMYAAEAEAHAAEARVLGLNVYADNTPALRLYDSLAYHPTEHHYYKPL